MDHCASVLLGFPAEPSPTDNCLYDIAIKSHLSRINRLFKDQGAVIANNADQLLDCLDPHLNSVSYLALLEAMLPSEPKAAPFDSRLAERIILFLRRFDSRQIRYYGVSFSTLFTCVASGHVLPAPIAVPLLAEALLRVDTTGSMFTSNHWILLKLAYSSNVLDPVIPVIEKKILYFPNMLNQPDPRTLLLCDERLPPPIYISKDTGLTTRVTAFQVLEYDYLVGLIHCTRREWLKARAAFARAAAHPSRDAGVSKVMVEAYKKWVLTCLLGEGQAPTPASPPLASQAATKTYAVLGRHYVQLAEHYKAADPDAARRSAELSAEQFAEDGNEAAVREVLAAHQMWQVANLRRVYSKVSIAEVRAQTRSAVTGEQLGSDDEVVRLVQRMIASGMLRAVVVPAVAAAAAAAAGDGAGDAGTPAHLVFLSPAEEARSEADVAREIEDAARAVARLGAAYKATRERLATSAEYIKLAVKEQSRRGGGDYDKGVEAQSMEVDDEDLMAGLLSGGH